MASRSDWEAKHRSARGAVPDPDPFLGEALEHVRLAAPAATDAVDIACGRGQHSVALAAYGLKTVAVDYSPEALKLCAKLAAETGLAVETRRFDLESEEAEWGDARFDVVAVFRYLHRPLVPLLKRIVRPGGIIIYKTFTRKQLQFGTGPRKPDYLLEEKELPELFADFRHLLYRETCDFEATAALVAQKP